MAGARGMIATIRKRLRIEHAAPALVFVVAWAAFANSLSNGFVYDDVDIIQDNPRLNDPWNVRTFLGTSYWHDADPTASLYRPLTIMSFALDRAVFGPGPFGVHFMNVTANALAATLVYWLVRRLSRRAGLALFAGLFFAVHPVHAEAVANGVGRAEVYSAVVMLAAAMLHLSHASRVSDQRPTGGKPGHGRLAAAVALYLVAMLFKESAAVLPGLLLVADWIGVHRDGWRAMLRRSGRYLAYAPALILFLILRSNVVELALPAQQEVIAAASGAQRRLLAAETVLRYAGQLCVPVHLSADYADYTRTIPLTPTGWSIVATLVGWAGVLGVCAWLAHRRSAMPLLGIAWFAVAILPVSNLIIPIGTIRADRLLYVPSVGFALFAAHWLSRLYAKRPTAAVVVLTLMLGFYGWRTVTRNRVWATAESLWTQTVMDNPGSAAAWSALGNLHRDRQEYRQAAESYGRSIELREGAGFFHGDARVERGRALQNLGDARRASEEYRTVLARRPTHYAALINLGTLLLNDPSSRAEAEELFERAVQVNPSGFEGHANLGQALFRAGRFADALPPIDRAIRLNPSEPLLWTLRATCLAGVGRHDEARDARREASRLER